MIDKNRTKFNWKQKIVSGMIQYWTLVGYLACFFGFFTWYRRIILAAHQISYMNYGVSLFEALVLAKVILIADVLRLGRGFEDKPLIVPTLYKTVVFTLWVALFSVLEQMVGGFLSNQGLAGGFQELMNKSKYELVAKCLVTFIAFIPFFAFKELARVLGREEIVSPFFRRREATTPNTLR